MDSKDCIQMVVKELRWHKAQCHRQWRGPSMDSISQQVDETEQLRGSGRWEGGRSQCGWRDATFLRALCGELNTGMRREDESQGVI